MAHQVMQDSEIRINTMDNMPEGYAATLYFLVKGRHLLDVHVTEDHLKQLLSLIQEIVPATKKTAKPKTARTTKSRLKLPNFMTR